jgi:hypothetical protein
MDIYMIEATAHYENRDRRFYTEETVEREHGYFTSLEKADAKAAELNEPTVNYYDKKTATLIKQQEAQELAFVEQMRQYEYLTEGGFEAVRPGEPRAIYIEDYMSYLYNTESTTYRVVKVEEAK